MLSNKRWNEEERKEIEENAYFKWVDAGKPTDKGSNYFWDLAEQQKIRQVYNLDDDEEYLEINFPAKNRKRQFYLWDTGYFYAPTQLNSALVKVY